MKTITKLFTGLLFFISASSTSAAIEYLRFEGQVEDIFLDFPRVAETGINQSLVYFDFTIDVDSRSDFGKGFSYGASLIGGSAGVVEDVFALEGSSTAEGRVVALGLSAIDLDTGPFNLPIVFHIGLNIDQVDRRGDNALIANWAVGDRFELIDRRPVASFDRSEAFGSVTLTYRANTPPPAYVPLPSSLFLFVTALGALRAAMIRSA